MDSSTGHETTPAGGGSPGSSFFCARKAFDDAPIALAWLAADGRILEANHDLCRLLATPARALIGRRLDELTVPEARDAVRALVTEAAAVPTPGDTALPAATAEPTTGISPASASASARVQRADGRTIGTRTTVRAARWPAVDDDGAGGGAFSRLGGDDSVQPIAGLVAAVVDLDERGKEEMDAEARIRFLAACSHDLRQPLNVLSLYLGILHTATSHRQALDIGGRMQPALDTAIDLFNALLDIARYETGRVAIRPERVEAWAPIRRVVEDFAPMAERKGIRLRAVSGRSAVFSDFGLLERVLRGLVAYSVHTTDASRVVVGCRRQGATVRFDVLTNGKTLTPAALRERLDAVGFAPPVGDHPAAGGRAGDGIGIGDGLGLAAVGRAAALLGQTVDVAALPGGGIRFSLALPAAAPGPEAARETAPVATTGAGAAGTGGDAALSSTHVPPFASATDEAPAALLVEDEPMVARAMAEFLEELGITVHCAAHGAAAERLVETISNPLRLIISDYRLPNDLDGLTTIERIWAGIGVRIPAILITGDLDPGLGIRTRDLGVALLRKPVRPETLQRMVESLLGGRTR